MNPFLDEVLKHPKDDGPRLIYADWLEELGDPRGEFIRVQCELAQTDPLDARHIDLSERNEDLLTEHRDQWAGELKQDIRKAEFHRGFIDAITIRARAFAQEADALFNATPVHWVRFNYVKGAGAALAAAPALRHIRSLDLSGLKIPHEDLIPLLSSPHLAELKELNLSYPDLPLGAEIGSLLSRSQFARTLRSLELLGHDYAPEFVNALVNGDGFPHLEHFAIGAEYREALYAQLGKLAAPNLHSLKVRGRLTVDDTNGLCQLPVEQITRLDLAGTNVPARGIQRLAERGAFDKVEELDLGNCDLPISGVRSLFQGHQLSCCRQLSLTGTHGLAESGRMPEFIQQLAGHEPLNSLRELQLVHLRQSELETLALSDHLKSLQSLSVTDTHLTVADASAIARGHLAGSLRRLSLRAASLDSEAAEVMCNAEFPNLLWLDLDARWDLDSPLDEQAVIRLIESRAFPALRSLRLNYLHLTAKTLDALASRSHCPELRLVFFDGNRADNDSVRSILNSDRLPKLRCLSVMSTPGMKHRPKLEKEFGGRIKT